MSNYFYRDKAGREIGPFDLAALSKFRSAGVLAGDTLVRAADSTAWNPCREIIADSPAISATPVSKGAVKKSSTGILLALIAIVIVVIIATRSSVQHAAEAEQAFRNQIESAPQTGGIKVVNFKPTSGQHFFRTNSIDASVVEDYKLNFEAEIESERNRTVNGIVIHRGDRAKFAGSMTGSKTEIGWTFRSYRFLNFIGASSMSDANLSGARNVAQANTCINNLRQIDGGKNQWALENHKTTGTFPSWTDLLPYLKDGKIPICPAGGIYNINAAGQNPTCSLGATVTPNHILP